VDVRDIAAAAAVVLTAPGHEGKAYNITGPAAITMNEVAAALSAAIDRPVEYVDLPPEAWIGGAVAAGIPEWLAGDLATLNSTVIAKNLSTAVSPSVRELTGREAIPFEQFARDYASVFRGESQPC
jgi:uncharacterized protein YbjT (DUF2867 family)